MEIWRDIEGYEGLYQVSNQGRVKRLKRISGNRVYPEKFLSTGVDKGRNTVSVALKNSQGERARKSLAWLVLTTFKGKPPKLCRDSRHKDGNPANNKLENLEWNITKAYYKPRNEESRKLLDKEGKAIVYNYLRMSRKSKLVNFGFCDTEDLAQECLIQIWNKIDWYDPKYSFKTFCYRVCDQEFKAFYRKNKPKREKCINFTDIFEGDYEYLDRLSYLSTPNIA